MDRQAYESERVSADRFHSPTARSNLNWFERFARKASILAGKPAAFFGAVGIVLVWLATGPVFGFSDTWQLVINTGTTVITFLMVFLIQHSQNRDTMALQIKLADLIIAVKGAKNELATAEDLSDRELSELHASYARKAEEALKHLQAKRREGAHEQASALDHRTHPRAS